jgi:predicted alpha/beta-hydrolase family hydrolase
MKGWARRFATIGEVVRFDYPYAREGRRSPDPLKVLIAAHRRALEQARKRHGGGAVILAGKSMGSRVGCHVALESPVSALVCLGYPLVGARGSVRDEVLLALRTPILFVQGTRDPLCPLERLEEVRHQMQASSALHVVDDGDHSLVVTKKHLAVRGATQEEVDRAALEAVRAFLQRHAAA